MDDLEREKIPFIDERDNNGDTANHSNGTNLPLAEFESESEGPRKRSFPDSPYYSLLPPKRIVNPSENKGEIIDKDLLTVTPVTEEVDCPIPSVIKKLRNGSNGLHADDISVRSAEFPERRTSSFKFQIHDAAKKGNVKELERLLVLKGDPLQTDFKKRTPLHYACEFPYQKKAIRMVEMIQKCEMPSDKAMELINYQDKNGETALHIAARTGHRKLAEKLIFAAADVNLKDKHGVEPLNLIYSKVPAAMIPVFDGALECKVGDPNDQNLVLQFDFGSIVGYPEPDKVNGMYELETKLLSYCLQQSEQKRSAILLHPVVQVFLHMKWKKIRILLWISILYHVIWLLLYTLFITDLYLRKCPYKVHEPDESAALFNDSGEVGEVNQTQALIGNSSHIDNGTGSDILRDDDDGNLELTFNTSRMDNGTSGTQCAIGRDFLSSLNLELGFLFYVTVSVVLKEIYEIYSTPQIKFYFYQLENVGQWILVGVVVLTSIPVFMEDDDNVIVVQSWQYQAAALGIFLAWSLILSQIGKIPRFAIYIEILGKVLKSFTLFMITFASLLVAFLVSFQILMPEKTEFSNFPWGFIKMMVMMAGEINYDDIFFDDESIKDIPFPLSTRLLYAAFVAVVTIILFNLLIGLTVSDIQGLESVALLSNLSSQLEQIYLMEKFIISKKLQRWLVRFKKNHWLRYFLVTQQDDNHETNMGLAIHISKIPRDLQYKVRELAVPIEEDDDDYQHDPVDKPLVMTEDNLKRIIKDVLKEVLSEMNMSNKSGESQSLASSATESKMAFEVEM